MKSKVQNELTVVDMIKALKKNLLLLSLTFVTGFIIIALFFVFRYPPISVSIRINSKDLGYVFKMIDKSANVLSFSEFNRFIRPIVDINGKERRQYRIEPEDTLIKKRANNNAKIILDLILSRKFRKKEKDLYRKFKIDLNDFFVKLEKQLFSWFYYDLRLKRINKDREKFILEKAIDINNISIETIKKYLNISSENFKDISGIKTFYLPPKQQLSGLIIARDEKLNRLEVLNDEIKGLKDVLYLIEKKSVINFRTLLKENKIKSLDKMFNRVKTIFGVYENMKSGYSNATIFTDSSLSGTYLMICSVIFFVIFLLTLVFVKEWWIKNKKNISK